MQVFLSVSLLLILATIPVYGQPLSDMTGLLHRIDIETGGHTFEVETISTFDIQDYFFDKDQKRITLYISSNIENNLSEVIIPHTLLSGNFTVYLNDQELHPNIRSNDKITFIVLEFDGSGNHQIDIFGDVYLGNAETPNIDEPAPENGGGCLIATAAYGSELASYVQMLREIRDNKIMTTASGSAFVDGFNHLYYSFSPYVADYQRENPAFNEAVRITITPLVTSLGIMSMADSEHKVLGYGIIVILINAGMYVVPVVILVQLRSIIR